jgi:TPR repeat protein
MKKTYLKYLFVALAFVGLVFGYVEIRNYKRLNQKFDKVYLEFRNSDSIGFVETLKFLEEEGHEKSTFLLGEYLLRNKDTSSAIDKFKGVIKSQSLELLSTIKIGQCRGHSSKSILRNGLDIEELIEVGEKGDWYVQFIIGSLIFDVGEIDKNNSYLSQGFKFLRNSAQSGYPPAMYKVGYALGNGLGVKVNFDKADFWLNKGSDLGNVDCLAKLGENYVLGAWGRPISTEIGVQMSYSAALKGNELAAYNFANWYLFGTNGIEVDEEAGRSWANYAIQNGNLEARKLINQFEQIKREREYVYQAQQEYEKAQRRAYSEQNSGNGVGSNRQTRQLRWFESSRNCRWCDREFIWGNENYLGFEYEKDRYGDCTIKGSITGDYCSKSCAFDGCQSNDR